MTFKKFKLQKKKEVEIKKEQPKSKELNIPKTHINRSIVDVINILLHTKQNTGLRKLLDLPVNTMDKNLYIFTSKVLELCLQDNFSNELCLKVLKRFITSNDKSLIYNLLFKYLEVSILSNRNYHKFLSLCIEYCPIMIIKKKEKLCDIIEDVIIKKRISSMYNKKDKYTIDNEFIFLRGEFIIH